MIPFLFYTISTCSYVWVWSVSHGFTYCFYYWIKSNHLNIIIRVEGNHEKNGNKLRNNISPHSPSSYKLFFFGSRVCVCVFTFILTTTSSAYHVMDAYSVITEFFPDLLHVWFSKSNCNTPWVWKHYHFQDSTVLFPNDCLLP